MTKAMTISAARAKRLQAMDAEQLATVAEGIGEREIASACWRLAGILRAQAVEIREAAAKEERR